MKFYHHRRYYKNPQIAHKKCNEVLEETRDCVGTKCPTAKETNRNTYTNVHEHETRDDQLSASAEDEDLEKQLENDRDCRLTEWTEEDGCSCDSGQGQRKKTREFKRREKKNYCMRKYPTIELEKVENCETPECDGESTTMKVSFCKM